jgi:hypothetical protein
MRHIGVGALRSWRTGTLVAIPLFAVFSLAACTSGGDGIYRGNQSPLIVDVPTCERSFQVLRDEAADTDAYASAEFDTLVVCKTRDSWLSVGARVLEKTEKQMTEYLDRLCDSGSRYAETPVCRDPLPGSVDR